MGPRRYVTVGEGILYIGIYVGEAVSGQISTAFRTTGTSWRWALKGVGIFEIGVGVVLRLILWHETPRGKALVQEDLPTCRILYRYLQHISLMRSFWLFTTSAGVRTLAGSVFGYWLYPSSLNIMSNYGNVVGIVGSVAALAGGAITSLFWPRTKLTPLYLVSVGGIFSSVFVLLMVFSRDVAGGAESTGINILYGHGSSVYYCGALVRHGQWASGVNDAI
ncbi:uncharacterized protein ATNIH1004_010507 [Aspergillus tanneri]|uniref:Uncharacterized protein n=1 Tax=Aspergillus tanneri TaxID=1220188 RepID=A0A5M9MFI5_9EURO|nr:uncharacterized protein ATNIH1004_010507 [Aspergillus tanneri]KAA8643733.1 hypothetical protein ATNIH1004_010507 [Aspergillus tanneri]